MGRKQKRREMTAIKLAIITALIELITALVTLVAQLLDR